MKLLGDYSRYDVGKLVRIHDADIGVVDVRVMKYAKSDVGEQPWAVSLEIGNKRDNLAVSQTDLERRQQINDTYSQGSTNVDSYPYQDNCDAQHPAVIRFYLDEDLINVNTLDLTLETSNFRAYSRAIEGGGAVVSSVTRNGVARFDALNGDFIELLPGTLAHIEAEIEKAFEAEKLDLDGIIKLSTYIAYNGAS